MSYTLVLGDSGPPMPLGLVDGGVPMILNSGTDTVTLHYQDPTGASHVVPVTILNAPTGACQVSWSSGDLPSVGAYVGQIRVARTGDITFPRTYPNDSNKIIWWVNVAL